MNSEIRFCPHCGVGVTSGALFCSQCGADLARLTQKSAGFSGKRIATIAALTGVLLLGGWGVGSMTNLGKRPTGDYKAAVETHEDLPPDPELDALRKAAADAPGNIDAHRALAAGLIDKFKGEEKPPQQLVFDLIGTLGEILKLAPRDPQALVTMADISFNQQVFVKAVDFYHRYLETTPDDHDARARLGSALTFIGKFDESIKELQKVLSKDPANFQAMAYLAITYSQKGDTAKALEIGDKAIAIAPSAEAKERFGMFLSSLKGPKNNVRGNVDSAPQNAGTTQAVVDFIKNNPVAGPKFVRSESPKKTELSLYLRDFPMSQMPPFAKEKFFGGIRRAAQGSELAVVIFFDEQTGKELDRLPLTEK